MPFGKNVEKRNISDTRRRLLKAVAGTAPAIMTLPVGTKAAPASLLWSANPVSPLEQPVNVIAGTGSWKREGADVSKLTLKRHAAGRYFEIHAWKINGTLYAAPWASRTATRPARPCRC